MEDRYDLLLKAVEAERKQEQSYFQSLSQQKSPSEKIEAGILWSPLEITRKHYTVGELIELELERIKHLGNHHKFKVGVGANLVVETSETLTFKGTISYIRKNKMRIILHDDYVLKDDILTKGRLSVEMIYDERPYRVMLDTLKYVRKVEEHIHKEIRDAIRNKSNFEGIQDFKDKDPYTSPNFNDSQMAAINGCAIAPRMSIIHGPPGTGKTTTIVGLIQKLSKSEKRILVCAPSNNAVDLLAKLLYEKGLNVLRVGNVTRIGDSIAELTLKEKARMHPDWQHIKSVRIEAENAKKIAGKYKRKFGQRQKNERREMFQESKELKKWARELEDRLMNDIIKKAQVVATTLISAQSSSLKGLKFKTVIIDEASQALEPECWVAMLKGERVIFAGDHMQLPPTVKSSDAERMGLAETILDRMSPSLIHSYLLKEQYRMHKDILSFSNSKFYNGELLSSALVANRKLSEDDTPLNFIDTSGCGFNEEQNADSFSKSNPGEFFIIREHILKNKGLYEGKSIGIICAYAAQVRYVRTNKEETPELKELDIEVDSIDGFQGQEKDVIYISLVRSNDVGEVGFLKDFRRLNVAMTRAKMKLVVVGDCSTLSSEQMFLDLVEHVEKTGTYESAWEYMS